MKKNKTTKNVVIGLIIVLIVVVGGGYVYSLNQNTNETENTTTSISETINSSTNDSTVDSEKEDEKTKDEFTKEGAVAAVTNILQELSESPDKELSDEDRVNELSKEDFDKTKIFTEEGWDKFHLADFMETDRRGEILIGQSMVSVIHAIKETGNEKLEPSEVDYAGVVLFDETMKTAYVPVDLYTNVPTNLSFEMVYINDEWKVQPYMLISQIAIRTMEQAAIAESIEGKSVLTDDNKEETKDSEDTQEEVTQSSNDD